ncbi:ribonuclease H-like domain-containing protein [Tanacetum coccineum]
MSTPTFAATHNLVAFLEKLAESTGFEQIIDFLNAQPIKYALTVNPTVYTSCIKQFWATAKVKKVNGQDQKIDQGVGSTSGIRACALRNFDLEVMELENTHNNALAKLPMLKLGEYETWEIRIKQYFQIQDYALWEVIENRNSGKVKKSAGASNDDKNLAFLTTSGASSTNNINTINPDVSTATTKVKTASTEISTASFSDATIYAFLSTQPQGSQLVHEDLEQLHDDDLEEMDLKWNMALLSMRARKFYQRTGRKIIIDGSNTAGYDKSKVECFNCHKMGHFSRECRAPRSKDNRNWNQGSSSKAVKIEDASEKEMCAIDGAGFDWSDMAKALKKQYDNLLVKLDDTGFKAATYKRGLATLEDQIVKYREHEVIFSEEIALLKRSVGHKEYQIGLLRAELEKVKQEKEGFEFKIAKFDKSAKDLEQLLGSQITDKSKKGLEEFKEPEVNEYGPRDSSLKPTIDCDKESDNSKENTDGSLKQHLITDTETSSVKSSLKVDKDWKEKFFSLILQPKSVTVSSTDVPTLKVDTKWKEKFFNHANNVRLEEPKKASENTDAPIIEDWVSDDEEEAESTPKVEKKIPIATKEASVNNDKPSRRTIRYAELYRSQRPRGNQRGWNGQKTDQLGCNFVFNNKACFICGDFDHIQYNCPNAYKHMVPRAVLMKTGLKTVKNTKPLSTVRSVNTARPVSTVRCVNTVRSHNTAHPKPTVSCARPKSHFQNQAQRPFFKYTALTNRSHNQNINTGRHTVNTFRPNVNTVRARGFNAVKPSACWVWRPIKPNGASLSNSQLNEKGFVDSGCSRHMSGNIAHLSDFKEFDGGYVTFGGGANGGRITGKGTIKTNNLDFEDVYFVKELKFNLFSVSQMCDKKNYVLFTDSECLVLSPNFKMPDESQILLKIPRQNNMYSFDMKNIVPKDGLTCLVAKATSEESMLWHRRLGHVNFKNINKLVKENLVRDLPLKRFENDQTCVACLKGKQHRASYKLGKFDGKSDEGFFVGYSLSSKAFRVYNIRTRKVQENLHVGFLENKPMLEGNGPKWLFDLDSLTQSMNYVPVVAGTFSNVSADASLKSVDDAQLQDQDGTYDDCSFQDDGIDDHQVNTASPQVNTGSRELSTAAPELGVEAMQEELLQFKLQNVWVLVDLPKGHRAIGTKWVYRNKKDERGIVVRNKARLVAQGHTKKEGIEGYKYHHLHVVSYPFGQIREDLSYTEEPESILDRQVRVMRKKTIPFVKILWRNHPEREATWETEESIRTSYPHFLP